MPHPLHPAPSTAAQNPSHRTLVGFLAVRRRTLAIATVLMSMLLVVVHDLPASASTLPDQEPIVEGQELRITPASLASPFAEPVTEERDDFGITLFTPVQWPVNPASTISSTFGSRSSPCAGCSTQHSGVDWTPGYGTPVHAIADGVVVSRPMSDWGSYVVIEHDIDGVTYFSGYAHLVSGSNAPVGTKVSRGDVIGRLGNTGRTSGAHLHFSIIRGDSFIDPLAWLREHVTQRWGS